MERLKKIEVVEQAAVSEEITSSIEGTKLKADFIMKNFGVEGGMSVIRSSLVRLYTLLDGFDATHVGLYAYFRSWRNSSDESRLNTVWHGKDYMQLQTGLGVRAVNARLKVLVRVGLITEIPKSSNSQRMFYYVHDPLSRDQFIEKYPDEVREFARKREILANKNKENRENMRLADLAAIKEVRDSSE